jgi:hypothetical protein
MMPALHTSASSRPSRWRSWVTARVTSSSRPASAWTNQPASPMRAAVAAPSALLSSSTARQPSRASRAAIAAPMPRAAPLIRATFAMLLLPCRETSLYRGSRPAERRLDARGCRALG